MAAPKTTPKTDPKPVSSDPQVPTAATTGDLTNPDIREGQDTEEVAFKVAYHIYNAGETARFSAEEAERLRGLGVAE